MKNNNELYADILQALESCNDFDALVKAQDFFCHDYNIIESMRKLIADTAMISINHINEHMEGGLLHTRFVELLQILTGKPESDLVVRDDEDADMDDDSGDYQESNNN